MRFLHCKADIVQPNMIPQDKTHALLENPYILITDKKLSNLNDLLPLLEQIMKTSRPLLIIAEDVEGEVLSTLAVNTLRGSFCSVAVKCPLYGEKQKDFLEDIALLSGGTFFSKELDFDLKTISLESLGEASIVKVFKDKTVIIGGKSNQTAIEEKKSLLHSLKTDNLDAFEQVNLQDRLARLSGGVAVIEVGAPTEVEMREKKLRIEDALSATKSATKEGIVVGGGSALLLCEELKKVLFLVVALPFYLLFLHLKSLLRL